MTHLYDLKSNRKAAQASDGHEGTVLQEWKDSTYPGVKRVGSYQKSRQTSALVHTESSYLNPATPASLAQAHLLSVFFH